MSETVYFDRATNKKKQKALPFNRIFFDVSRVDANPLVYGSYKWVSIPADCRITKAICTGTPSGSVVWDLRKCTYAQFDGAVTRPNTGDSICASAKPTLSSATKSEDTTLTGWTLDLTKGDILLAYVVSVSGLAVARLELEVQK